MSADLLEAIKYVRQNVDVGEVCETRMRMGYSREPLYHVNPSLSDKVYDLMEEYSEDNNLPEGWWLSECDEEQIVESL